MTFTESITVAQTILDAVAKRGGAGPLVLREDSPGYGEFRPACWDYVPGPQLPRQSSDLIVEPWVPKLIPGELRIASAKEDTEDMQ